MMTYWTADAGTPARSSAAAMATPPRSLADLLAREPSSLPTGVRAAPTITGRSVMSATIPMLTPIDHVGIACKNLEETVARYQGTFSLEVVSFEVNEAQGFREAMLGAGPGYIQLLEPLGPDTPVGKFLARRGEGIHHIGYGVESIHSALDALKLTEVRLLDERPRHGSMGASIAFLHPADLGGVLTELVQAPAGAKGIYRDA